MAATLPSLLALAGEIEPRVMEAQRLARFYAKQRAEPSPPAQLLIAATDAAMRENMLRWLQDTLAGCAKMCEAMNGPGTPGDADWLADLDELALSQLAPLADYIAEHAPPQAPEDSSWSDLVADGALANPATVGDAVRAVRDLWHQALLAEQRGSRQSPGRWLASVGIVKEHVDAVAAEQAEEPAPEPANMPREVWEAQAYKAPKRVRYGEVSEVTITAGEVSGVTVEHTSPETAPGSEEQAIAAAAQLRTPPALLDALALRVQNLSGEPVTIDGVTLQPQETYVPPPPPGSKVVTTLEPPDPAAPPPPPPLRVVPDMSRSKERLPGTIDPKPDVAQLVLAMALLRDAGRIEESALLKGLNISRSSFNNWCTGKTVPRITDAQIRVLRAECTRLIGDLTKAEDIFNAAIRQTTGAAA